MKHKTWFRLVIKAIGVLLVGLGLEGVLRSLVFVVLAAPWTNTTWNDWGWPFVSLLQPVIGVYLFLRGEWIVNLAIPSNRPYCPECGYDLARNEGAKCPECGVGLAGKAGA